jgi:HSP20 family protein
MPPDDWQREVERYLQHFSRTGKRPQIVFTQHGYGAPGWTPAVDMYETDDSLVVLLELAGVDADKTEVQAEAALLTIRGERRERHVEREEHEQRTYHALEIPYGRFERSVRLPAGIDTSAAEASYRDGLLEIRLPKRAPRQVRVGISNAGAP